MNKVFLLAVLFLVGCGNSLTNSSGVNQVSLKNDLTINGTPINGVAVVLDSGVRVSVDYGGEITLPVSGEGTHRLVATSDAFTGEAIFNFTLKGSGGHAKLTLFLNESAQTVNIRCDNGCS